MHTIYFVCLLNINHYEGFTFLRIYKRRRPTNSLVDGVSSHQKRYLTEFVQDKYHLISPGIRRLQIFLPRISLEEDDQRDPGCYLLTNKKFIENT